MLIERFHEDPSLYMTDVFLKAIWNLLIVLVEQEITFDYL